MAVSRATPAFAAGTAVGRLPVALLALGVVAVAVARLSVAGWAGVAPDDARYLYVGLSVLDGRGPLTPDGATFLLRSPAYGVVLGLGSRLVSPLAGGDLLFGARLAAVCLMLLGLVGAIRLAWLLGGRPAAVVTTTLLVATPLVWRLVPTLRIDLVQTAGVVAVLLILHRPTIGRWVLAGAVLGLTVLVKESALLLVALPLAWIDGRPDRQWLARTAAYVLATVAIAGWWWVVVWVQAGAVFPANALAVIEGRQVGADLEVGVAGFVLVGIMAAGWLVVAARARHERAVRGLFLAALLLLPPAVYTFANGLDARNYAGLAVLSAIAPGIAAERLIRLADRRRLGIAAIGAFGLLVGLGQVEAGAAYEPPLPARLAAWMGDRLSPGDKVAMTFRFRALVAVEMYGRTVVEELRPARVQPDDDPRDYVCMGLRDRQLFGYRRGAWARTLGDPAVRYLAIAEPHFFAPVELEPFLASAAAEQTGIRFVERLEPEGPTAAVYSVTPGRVGEGTNRIPLHVTSDALAAWLALAGPDAAARLTAAGPIVTGDTVTLEAGCSEPAGAPFPEGWRRLIACP